MSHEQLALFTELVGKPQSSVNLTEESIRLARSIRADRTVHGYAADLRLFTAWCTTQDRQDLPATTETVVHYLTDMLCSGRKISTAKRHLCAIIYQHDQAGHPRPSRREAYRVITGAQRLRREQPVQKAPVSVEQLRRMIEAINKPEPYRSRDRALLLLGFTSALRRSSIVALDLGDIEFTASGLVIHIRREKQDQTGVGRKIGIPFGTCPTCPVEAVQLWLRQRGSQPGPLFPSLWHKTINLKERMRGDTIAQVIKRAVESIGLDPAKYAGHSLRAGFVTSALEQGAGEILTARHTGHRSLQTLKGYMRSEDPFKENACARLAL